MKKFRILAAIVIAFAMTNCDDYDSSVDAADVPLSVGFARATDLYKVDPTNPVYQLKVTSTQVSNVDRVVTVTPRLDLITEESEKALPGDYQFDNTIVIPAGSYIGYGTVTFDFDVVPAGKVRKTAFELVIPNDGSVRNDTKDQIIISYNQKCLFNELELYIKFDQYSEEVSWAVYDAAGNVAMDSNGEYAEGVTEATETLCLEDGSYFLVVSDTYGDGLTGVPAGQPMGYYTVTGITTVNNISTRTLLHTGQGNYGSEDVYEFTVGQ